MIAHTRSDGQLDKKWLKGLLGDAIHALLCGAEHNLRMLRVRLRVLFAPSPYNWS